MQRMGLRSLASCAWFFDDLDRIEPINALTYALRAMDLAVETNGPDLGEKLLATIEPARANAEPRLNGRELFMTRVLPRRESPQSLIAQALLTTAAGLLIAIFTLFPYNYFVSKAEKAALRMEKYATSLEIVHDGEGGR